MTLANAMRSAPKSPLLLAFLVSFLSTVAGYGEDRVDLWLDDLSDRLSFSVWNDQARGQLSGAIDLEYHSFDGAPPGLIDTYDDSTFQHRTSLFFDLQVGPALYAFAQARIDRGFDPSDGSEEARLDEYLLRYTPWEDGRFNLQIGRFSTIVGQWYKRHLSWQNPFVTAPLIYDQVALVSDIGRVSANYTASTQQSALYDYNPIIWGPSYATGAAVSGKFKHFEWAIEAKNAALASRPYYWKLGNRDFDHPTTSARIAWRPDLRWNVGVSASKGQFLGAESRYGGVGASWRPWDLDQTVYMLDASYEWRHFQLWLEFVRAEFEFPYDRVGRSTGYFIEGRYKLSPRTSVALRLNQQSFDDLAYWGSHGGAWGEDQIRLDMAFTWRLNAHAQLQLEFDLRDQKTKLIEMGDHFATRFTLRF